MRGEEARERARGVSPPVGGESAHLSVVALGGGSVRPWAAVVDILLYLSGSCGWDC